MSVKASPISSNRLGAEKSPYLLQHKDNPVNWYAWGPEAFAAARTQSKPIFLSIGYSTCYWCHVMEKDSFETEEIAQILNRSFVSIKVDREEHPDIDKIYMDAVVAMTGQGGWPMSVFLTPELKPFFGGTFFPRQQFAQILNRVDALWMEERGNVNDVATKLTGFLERYDEDGRGGVVDTSLLRDAYQQFSGGFDETFAGFGPAPKFPRADAIQLLLRINRRSGDPRALKMAENTLEAMARGGLYDHVGGGFHRYSTDERWLVPHFEKMLYDNALLTVAYLEGYRLTGRELFASVARETLDYVLREMTSPEGAFYSAQDAGEVKREGEFYVWTEGELKTLLSADAFKRFSEVYGVTPSGNFEHGATVLSLQSQYDWSVKDEALLRDAAAILKKQRDTRPAPHKDDKILSAWNGLMIHALVQGYLVLGDARYLEGAQRASEFIISKLSRNGELLRRYRDGDSRFDGYIDDYAFVIQSLISLYEATGDVKYVSEAKILQATQDRLFWDDAIGAYFHSAGSRDELIVRKKEMSDGAMPSGNSVAALNLLRLFGLTLEENYSQRAQRLVEAIASQAKRYPSAFSSGLCALDWMTDDAKEVAVVGAKTSEQQQSVRGALAKDFSPNKVVAMGVASGQLPLLENKMPIEGKVTYYVCSGHTCKAPTTDPVVALKAIRASRKLSISE